MAEASPILLSSPRFLLVYMDSKLTEPPPCTSQSKTPAAVTAQSPASPPSAQISSPASPLPRLSPAPRKIAPKQRLLRSNTRQPPAFPPLKLLPSPEKIAPEQRLLRSKTRQPPVSSSSSLREYPVPDDDAAVLDLKATVDKAVAAAVRIARAHHNDISVGKRSVGRQKNEEWLCGNCEKKFDDLSRYRRHVESHLAARMYRCSKPDCGKSFYSPDNLRNHVKTHIPNHLQTRYKCVTCRKDYKRRADVNAHMKKSACPFINRVIIVRPTRQLPNKQGSALSSAESEAPKGPRRTTNNSPTKTSP